MKPINWLLFLAAFNCCCFYAVFAVWGATIADETGVTGFAYPYYVIRFPAHTILFDYLQLRIENSWVFVSGLLFNCSLYGLILERIIVAWKKRVYSQFRNSQNLRSRFRVVILDIYLALAGGVSLAFTLALSDWALEGRPAVIGTFFLLLSFMISACSLATLPALINYLTRPQNDAAKDIFTQAVGIQGLIGLVGWPLIWSLIN